MRSSLSLPSSTSPPPDPSPRARIAPLLTRRGTPEGEQRERLARLARLHGAGELRAALLALIETPGSARELRAWRDETRGLPSADAVRADVLALPAQARLPWFELFATRAAKLAVIERRSLVRAARRVMGADGQVGAAERLWWLGLRHRLGEGAPPNLHGERENDLAQLGAEAALAVGVLTAYLSRLVPERELDLPLDAPDAAPGERWYRALMARFGPRLTVPSRDAGHDADAVPRALRTVQALPWLLRPVLARAWVDEALQLTQGNPLPSEAADALRIACTLLDSPLPSGLVDLYIEPVLR